MARSTPQHTDEEAANPLAGVGEEAPDGGRPLEDTPPAPPARVEPVVVPRWVQLVLLPLAWLFARALAQRRLIFGFDAEGRLVRRKGVSGRLF